MYWYSNLGLVCLHSNFHLLFSQRVIGVQTNFYYGFAFGIKWCKKQYEYYRNFLCPYSQERPLNSAENFLAAEKSATMQKRLGEGIKTWNCAKCKEKKSRATRYCIWAVFSSKIKEHFHLIFIMCQTQKSFCWPTFLYGDGEQSEL